MEEKLVELLKISNLLEKNQDEYFITIIYSSFEDNLLTVAMYSKLDFSMQQRFEISLETEPIAKLDSLIRALKIFMGV